MSFSVFTLAKRLDWGMMLPLCFLLALGLSELYSVTGYTSPFHKQCVWIILGFALFLVVASVDYHVVAQYSYLFYWLGIAGLFYLLVFGEAISGARSWLVLGGLHVQVAEPIKIFTILYVAWLISQERKRLLGSQKVLRIVLFSLLPMILIALQPDLGTALVFLPILLVLLFFQPEIRVKRFLALLVILLLLLPSTWLILADYQKKRIVTFLNPTSEPRGSGYQVIQSRIAIGSGSLTGKGFRQGTQSQLRFLPETRTDFIFSVLAEERGFLGVLIALAAYLFLLFRILFHATLAQDGLGFYYCLGFAALLLTHIVINVGMASGLVPTIGIPLPFLSYGGSFTVSLLIGLGLVTNIRQGRFYR